METIELALDNCDLNAALCRVNDGVPMDKDGEVARLGKGNFKDESLGLSQDCEDPEDEVKTEDLLRKRGEAGAETESCSC